MTPRFATEEYWDDFFASKKQPFEWLLDSLQVRDIVSQTIENCPPRPQLLHIGCGNSELSWHLRELVDDANQVHNVDYSEVAVQAGRNADDQRFSHSPLARGKIMRWSRVDLLSLTSIQEDLLGTRPSSNGLFDLIVDKGTTDSIAIGEDVTVDLPYRLTTDDFPSRTGDPAKSTRTIHPLNLLAVHLATLSVPKTGRWILISFSEDRLPFLPLVQGTEVDDALDNSAVEGDVPDPAALWTLEKKWSVEAPPDIELTEPAAYKPSTVRWIYVLLRTAEKVRIGTKDR